MRQEAHARAAVVAREPEAREAERPHHLDLIERQETRGRGQQDALARAVGAHDGVDLAAPHGEVDAPQDLLVADGGPQALDLQRAHLPPSFTFTMTSPSTTETG